MPLAAILALSACGGGSGEQPAGNVKRNVTVEEVKLVPVEQLSTFTATVEAKR